MFCEINSHSSAAKEILHHRPQYRWVQLYIRISLHLRCAFFCITKSFKVTSEPLFISRWEHCCSCKCQCFIRPLCIWLYLFVCGIIVWSMLCFPQFTALYPEMVDALVLLDAFGLVPTDSVRTILTPQITVELKQFVWWNAGPEKSRPDTKRKV